MLPPLGIEPMTMQLQAANSDFVPLFLGIPENAGVI